MHKIAKIGVLGPNEDERFCLLDWLLNSFCLGDVLLLIPILFASVKASTFYILFV
jgi:hypothetical protein